MHRFNKSDLCFSTLEFVEIYKYIFHRRFVNNVNTSLDVYFDSTNVEEPRLIYVFCFKFLYGNLFYFVEIILVFV